MARGNLILNSFESGELSRDFDGRTDLKLYNKGLSTARNITINPTGGFTKRPGTYYISTAKDSDNPVRLIPFEYSVNDSYVLEFGNGYIRFYTDGGQVVSSGSAYEIVSPYTSTDVESIQYAQTADTMYLAHEYYKPRKLVRNSDGTWTISEMDYVWGPFLDENEDTDITVTPSATTGEISLTISGSEFVSTQVGGYWQIRGTKKVEKSATAQNQFTENILVNEGESVIFSVNGTWVATVTVQKTYDNGSTWVDYAETTSNVGVSITETDEGVYYRAGIKTGDYTSGTAEIRLALIDYRGYLKIDSYIDANTISGTVIEELPTTDATYTWSEGAWSDYNGYPATVAFYQQRLVFGGNSWKPQTVWGSVLDDYENFKTGSLSTDAYVFTLASTSINQIQWMLDTKYLHIGTSDGEWRLYGNESLSPLDVNTDRGSSYGSESIQAMICGHTIVYVQRGGKKVRTLIYDLRNDSFLSPNIGLRAEHLLSEGIKNALYVMRPNPIIWIVTDDGNLLSCTFEPSSEINNSVIAFAKHTTNGTFKDICKIPGNDRDEIWAVVERTINGTTYKYIEQFNSESWKNDSNVEDANYLDCSLTYSGTAVSSLTGADHLEGEEVSIFANGAVRPSETVTSGTIELESNTTKAHVGLPFTSYGTTMRLDMRSQTGSIQGKRQRSFQTNVRFKDTIGAKLGRSISDGVDVIPFRKSSDLMGSPPALFTGDKQETFNYGFDDDIYITVASDQPTPFTVVAIMSTAYGSES